VERLRVGIDNGVKVDLRLYEVRRDELVQLPLNVVGRSRLRRELVVVADLQELLERAGRETELWGVLVELTRGDSELKLRTLMSRPLYPKIFSCSPKIGYVNVGWNGRMAAS
jgi:hypothetical protein